MAEDTIVPSFTQVYEDNFLTVYRVAYGITQNSEVAEDICQEVFIRYTQYEKKVYKYAKYWLIRVSRNLAINIAKRKQKEHMMYSHMFKNSKMVDPAVDKSILKEENKDMLIAAISKLPIRYKEVIIMKQYADLPYRDIAKALHISESNVKVRMYRARVLLKKLLKTARYEHENI